MTSEQALEIKQQLEKPQIISVGFLTNYFSCSFVIQIYNLVDL